MAPYWPALFGGMIIGLACVLLLLVNGRIAGISGIVGRAASGVRLASNGAFILGLIAGPMLYAALFGHWAPVTMVASLPIIGVAGLLVGFGTRMGSGCTSGHGILGLARISQRSIVATLVFLAVAMLTATAGSLLG